ncbi:MAG: TonB-dependent receptor [Betaproteobacteria bacterium]|nr:TonB-dependent receptor [Betaproteobacteria bacterium]
MVRRFLPAYAPALLFIAATALAQNAPPIRLPEVTVSATRVEHESFDLPVSVDSIGRRAIGEDNPQVNLSEALNRAPGVVVQNRQNYAQDLQISSRGFGARASFGVRGIRLIADGIPATMPDGQGQAASFNLSSAQRIEVLRGPFSGLYGNAAGGVIQIFTTDGPREPTLTGSVLAGRYDTRKFRLQYGGQHGPLNVMIDASRFDTDGYRDHSAARRDHVNAKMKIDTGARGVFTLVLNVLDQPESQDPLGLTAAQMAQNRRQAGTNALAFNTRKSVAQSQAGFTYDLALSARDTLQARAYAGDRQVTQFLAIPLGAQTAPTSSGGGVDLDRGYSGVGLRLTRETTAAGAPLTVSAGIDYDRMAERRRGFINSFGAAGALKRDEDDTVANTDFYAQAEWRFAPRWNLLAGIRHSRVRFASRDFFVNGANPDDSGSVDFTRTTPAAGLTFRLAPAVNLYANAGKGFETPTFAELAYRPGGATGLNFALKPANSTHRELGVKALIGAAGRINVALFRIDVKDEIVVNSSSGGRTDFKNAARTRREGLELFWESRFAHGFESAVAYTLLDVRFTQPFTVGAPPAAVPAGNKLPGVPPSTLYGEVVWRHAASGFHAGVEGKRNGKVYVNDANSEFASAYTVWNLRAGFEQRGRQWRLTEFVRLDNATDRRYVGSIIVAETNGRFYEPAPGRSLFLGVSAQLSF